MATEKIVTKVKYRLKNGTSTTLPLGTTSDYVQMDDGEQENLTQRLTTMQDNFTQGLTSVSPIIRPKKLDILQIQSHLNAGTIANYCKIGDYIELNPDGKGITKFYIIGINGHNGQLEDHIYKDHVDFYGGATMDFESVLPANNFTSGEDAQKAAWRKTSFFKDYINGDSYQSSNGIKNFFGLNTSTYNSLNFAPKNVFYDERWVEQKPISTVLGYFGYNIDQWIYFQQLAAYTPTTASIAQGGDIELDAENETTTLSETFQNKITAIQTHSNTSLKLLRALVRLEPDLATFETNGRDSLVALRQSTRLISTGEEFLQLYNLYMRIYEWVIANSIVELTSSTGMNRQECYLWMLSEEEIDNNNILGTPQYTALTGYNYPFFQNKQLFRLLFPSSNASDKVFHSITPVDGSSTAYASWLYRPTKGFYKIQSNASSSTSIEGFGFRLESSSNKTSYPS